MMFFVRSHRKSRNSLQGFHEERAGAGDVDTEVALARDGAIHRAGVQPDAGLLEEAVAIGCDRVATNSGGRARRRTVGNSGCRRPSGKTAGSNCCGDIDPDEVGAFEGHNAPLGEVLGNEIAEGTVVVPEVAVEGIKPVLAIVIGGLDGLWSEGVDIAHLVDIDGAV